MSSAVGRRSGWPARAAHRLPHAEFQDAELASGVRNVLTLPDGSRLTVALRTGLEEAALVRPVFLRLELPSEAVPTGLWLPPSAARAAGVRLIVAGQRGERPSWAHYRPLPV